MRFPAVLAHVLARPWAIEEQAGRRLMAILSERVSGEKATPAQLTEAAGIKAARQEKGKKRAPGVAVIPIHGVMIQRPDMFDQMSGVLGTVQIGQLVDAAADDPATEAIVLSVDSPGGEVFGTEELARKVAAATKQKKVIAVADPMAASAAYYVISQASEVVVTPSGWLGSIGVMWAHVDQSAAMEKAGVKITLLSSTPEKIAGNAYEPLNDLGRAEMESHIGGFYSQFVKAVASGRGVSQEKVKAEFGKGGMLLAADAVRVGMADKVATLDDVLGRYGMSTADLTPRAEHTARMQAVAERERFLAALDDDARERFLAKQ